MSDSNKGMIIGSIISTTSFSIGLVLAKLLFIQPVVQLENTQNELPQTILVNQINSNNLENSTERASNVQWFKDNNKYIWDGWKIK